MRGTGTAMRQHRRTTSAAAALAVGLFVAAVSVLALTATTAQAGTSVPQQIQPAAATPSPTLGSNTSAPPNPPGSADGDTNDWPGMKLLPIGLLIPILIVGGVLLAKRRDRKRDDSSPNPPSPRVN